ncbi:MAG TPA: hypothetical protein VGI81_16675 [Tepidisphaeraceae bacterium]|jgi:hypothetical protein
MNFDQTNDPTQDAAASPSEPQPEGEFLDEAALAGGGGKKSPGSMYVLGGLAAVGAAVVWFMFFRGAPQAAQAAPTGAPDIKQFLDNENIALMKQTLKDTEKVVQQFRAYPAQTQVPLASLKSNPFRELAPKADAPVARNDDEAKEHAKIVSAVAELHLQSIMRGGKYKACMINNTLYKQGEQIGMFTLQEVSANTVVIESGKYRFELKMQN